MKKDFGIIGAGPAGYIAAIRAAQLGKTVTLFEKEFVGGTCLNKGCIPTKSFLHAADLYNSLKKASNYGINIENYSVDFQKVVEKKEKTVEKIRKSLEKLIKSYDIEIIYAKADYDGEKITADGQIYEFENVLVATGSAPKCVGGFEFDHKFILSSDDVLKLEDLPKSIVIVGSGAIGIEWARIFSSFGVDVKIIEIAEHLLPLADIDVSLRLERLFKMAKIKFYLSTSVKSIQNGQVELSTGETIEPDFVLFATGRKALDVKNLNKEILIGDVYGSVQLAHFASHQAVQKIENIILKKPEKDFLVPAVVYGNPEIAWVGKTEQELLKEKITYKKSIFPVAALGKAQTDGEIDGFVKILSDDNKIFGAHIVSKEASALIHQISIAMQNNLSPEDIKNCCFAHPTYSEGVYEALLGLDNEALSLPKELV